MEQQVITERELPAYRAAQFAPDNVLGRLPGATGALLFNEPPGIGKTTLGRRLISAAPSQTHDLVVFVAPTRAIIKEVECSPDLTIPGQSIATLRPRPSDNCGIRDAAWNGFEAASCAALGKEELCRSCPQFDQCLWPDQIERINEKTRLILLTEQYLILNPTMIPSLIRRTSARKPLVIFDEALFLTQAQQHRISRAELENFAYTLRTVFVEHELGQQAVKKLAENITYLLDTRVHMEHQPRFFPGGLKYATLAVQRHGISLFGQNYRHLAHDLSLLNSPVTTGQWQENGSYEIAVRVDTGQADVVILAPNMEPALIEERLGRTAVVANEGFVFRHSGTRVLQIRDSIGSARSMGNKAHRKRVIDSLAALVLRYALNGKRSVLVGKKKFLAQIAEEIEAFTTTAGFPLRIHLLAPGDDASQFTPHDVVLINYGIVGINTLKEFDAIITVGSYNITDSHLTSVYNQSLPPKRRHGLRIRTQDRRRVVEPSVGSFSDRFHARRAAALHRTLERRVVLQAVGRARPFTSPTDVVVFQQDDFEDCFGHVEVFDTLGEFRTRLRLPTVAEIKCSALGDQVRAGREQGLSYRALAQQFGVSVSTAHKAATSSPLISLLKGDTA